MNKDNLIPQKCIYCNALTNLIEIEADEIACHCFVCQSCFNKHNPDEIGKDWTNIWNQIKKAIHFDYDMTIDLTNDLLTINYTTSNLVQKKYSRNTSLPSAIMTTITNIVENYNNETPDYNLSLTIRCYESSIDAKIINKIQNYLQENLLFLVLVHSLSFALLK